MADVINRTTLELRRSVNTPDYPEPTWQASPDLSQIVGVAQKHRKWDSVADRPVAMTTAEQAAVDAAALTARKDAEVAPLSAANTPDLLRALALVLRDEVNILRAQHGLADRSVAQLKNALKGKMNG